MPLFGRFGSLVSKVPTPIWVVLLTPLIGIAGSEIQRFLDARAYPEINKERVKSLEGKWEGFGIQSIADQESRRRLMERKVLIPASLNQDLLKSYNDCTFTQGSEKSGSVIWFPAHLTLTAERTSLFSRKHLQGTLEITPVLTTSDKHPSSVYTLNGRLERNGDYIRLDYTNADPTKKDFGTILLENNSEGKLCGQFLSFGPISRSIVNGKYFFTR